MEDRPRERNSGDLHLQEPSPSQIVREIFGGHTVKPFQPFFQSAVVGVDVLDVEDALDYPFSMGRIDRPVGDPRFLGQGEVLGKTVVAENGVLVQDGKQCVFESLTSVVMELRSRATRTGTQWLGSIPVLGALVPRFRAGRFRCRSPFRERRMNVSSDSTIPPKEGRFLLRGTG